jgi:hypothetical protein
LLRQHQQRSHIHDGLKNLSNQEIIQKVTESPNKLKARAKSLLYFLRKNNVRLTAKGEIDYSKIEAHIQHVVRKQEQLCKLVLMQ